MKVGRTGGLEGGCGGRWEGSCAQGITWVPLGVIVAKEGGRGPRMRLTKGVCWLRCKKRRVYRSVKEDFVGVLGAAKLQLGLMISVYYEQ